ncbi:MAG: 16S rRNA (guanine(527)-N(7))-methyltransferase RsmG [Desulfomonilaceae bacterium]
MTVCEESSFRSLVSAGSGILGIRLPGFALSVFEQYAEFLLQWNRRLNLTSLQAKKDLAVLHFLDSLTILKLLPLGARSLLDIGSGAGFPGMVLKIAQPQLNVFLLDPNQRKMVFLKNLCAHLQLAGVHFLPTPIQELPLQSYSQAFDAVVSRALSLRNEQIREIQELLSCSGLFICMRGPASFGDALKIPYFKLATYWGGYLPFLPVYRRVLGYAPS